MATRKTTNEQPTEQHTVQHYPLHPFGRYAAYPQIRMGRHYIEIIGASTAGCEPLPLSGCALDDPLSDPDKAMLLERGLATLDTFSGQFVVDYAAVRAHLRTVCDVRDEDLPGLTWSTTMEILRPADGKPEVVRRDPPDDIVTFDAAQGLFLVSRLTLQRAVTDGKLRSFRKGEKGPHLVRKSDLDRLFTRRK